MELDDDGKKVHNGYRFLPEDDQSTDLCCHMSAYLWVHARYDTWEHFESNIQFALKHCKEAGSGT